ncbi:SIR2 family protein [Nocardia salmonicida]|uniref:SIR2 family protein n=1 Tax=Nocardia salmonicida TaxID=53431 RepID=UPI0013F4D438|nr:SIR2 family protein [Nocardia salmonicida]
MSATRSSSPYDATTMMALSLHASPGVYALVLGSGISQSSGVGTGWDITKAIVKRMAALDPGDDLPSDFDAEQWWKDKYPIELGYSAVLEASGMSAADRKNLLKPFFVPTEEDLKANRKVPTPAHHAIARLVKRGAVRVIVTTNFDDLAEKALDALGVPHQVIASPAMIAGTEPLCHVECTIIKVHGDYTRIDQLNTEAELASYHDDLDGLLDQVFDEYGLITCGWSADWDKALVEAITRAPSRRYPLYWTARGALGTAADNLVKFRRGIIVEISGADEFFTGLAERLEILDRMANPPPTLDIAIGQLKRYLPDPVRRIDLRDLFDREVQKIRSILTARPQSPPAQPVPWREEMAALERHAEMAMHLIAHGIILDGNHDHDELWTHVVQQLMRAAGGDPASPDAWKRLARYPAFLVLKAASFAAVQTGRDDLLIRLHHEPTCPTGAFNSDNSKKRESRAVEALYEHRLFKDVPLETGNLGTSKLVRDQMEPVLVPLVGDRESFVLLADRVEYRVALLQQAEGRPAVWFPACESLRAVGRLDGPGWEYEGDFTAHAEKSVWVNGLGLEDEATLHDLQESLKTEALRTLIHDA